MGQFAWTVGRIGRTAIGASADLERRNLRRPSLKMSPNVLCGTQRGIGSLLSQVTAAAIQKNST